MDVPGEPLRELALFAGAGGGLLGSILNGWRTVCAVEIDDYCRRVLLQRQRDGVLDKFPLWDDVRTFDGRPWRGCVDIVTGGFPCQDISSTGSGAGIAGPKSGLWKQMVRIIREVKPRRVLVENSPMLTSRGLGVVLSDLARLGFDARWGVFSAAVHGAPHIRARIFILADTASHAWEATNLSSMPRSQRIQLGKLRGNDWVAPAGTYWAIHQPKLSGMDDGMARRMGRPRAIGNGQVPCVVRAAWRLLR